MDTSWKPIDFQGIVSLDTPLIDYLEQYLQEAEDHVSREIIESIPSKANSKPLPKINPDLKLKLSEAIEIFAKRDYHNGHAKHPLVTKQDINDAIKNINSGLGHYLETIESSVSELFHQLDQLGLERWHERMSLVIGTIKDMLIHRLEDFVWAVKRLDALLWRAKLATEVPHSFNHWMQKTRSSWEPLLDASLLKHAKKTQTILRDQFRKFIKPYNSFLQLQEQVEQSLSKMSEFRVLASLERESRILFLKIYQLLTLLDLSKTKKGLPSKELVRSLQNIVSPDKARSIFREYYNNLRNTLFEKSLFIKHEGEELAPGTTANEEMEAIIKRYQAETDLLHSTVVSYHEYLLRAHSEQHIKMLVGITDRLLKSEPKDTKPFAQLNQHINMLKNHCKNLLKGLQTSVSDQVQERLLVDQDIHPILQEITNPLISRELMQRYSKEILEQIGRLDEMGSRDPEIIGYFEPLLNRLLRLDWKYHVLFSYPQFHDMFGIHQYLVDEVEDRHHAGRIHKFQKLTHQILEWVKAGKAKSHAHDIELEMNDIKGYLQDFLGYIQRHLHNHSISRDKAMLLYQDGFQQLLEYRYLFGNFFYELLLHGQEGAHIRKQFLFVDNYFESIEKHLGEIPSMLWSDTLSQHEEESIEEENEEG